MPLARPRLEIECLEQRQLMTVDPRGILISGDFGEASWAILGSISLPAFSYVQGPTGVTAPGQVFDPASAGITFDNTPAPAAPDLSEWTRTAGPDDSIAITGDDFSSYLGGLTRFYVFSDSGPGPGKIVAATTQFVEGDDRATITLPTADLPPNAMYMMWAADDDGVSRPVAINQTETWWIGPNQGQAGQKIAVFGRNLSQNGAEWISGSSSGSAPAWVWITPASGGPAVQATVTAVNPYRVEFLVPSSLAPGNYKAWVHNGRGGAYGWGTPLDFVVRSAQANGTSWTGPTYTTANTTQLAQMLTNAATADDGVLLQAVLSLAGQAQNAYSTVVLPAGTFLIANPLNLPSNVRLIGQGMNQTVLKAIPSTAFNNLGLFYGANNPWASNNVLMQDLTLHNGYNPLGPTDTAYTGGIRNLIRYFSQADVRFTRVRFDSRSFYGLDLNSTQRVTMDSCEFYGPTPIFLNDCRQTFITNSTFYLTNFGGQGVYAWGGEQLSITGSTARSESTAETFRTAKWGLRLFVNGHGGRFEYLAHNTTTQLGITPGFEGNVGENILWEGASPVFIASPTAATSSTVTFNLPSGGANVGAGGYYITVVQGKGIGQTRRIVAQSTTASSLTVSLENPLDVLLDSTSVLQVLQMAEKNVVYANSLNGLLENATRETYVGPAGVVLFGGTSNIIVDKNSFTNVRLAIAIVSTTSYTATPLFEPSIFNVIANNTITGSRYGIVLYAAHSVTPQTDVLAREKSTLSGNVIRGNTIQNAIVSGLDVAFVRETADAPTGQIIDNLVIEHNQFVGLPVAMNFALGLRTDYRGIISTGAAIRNALVYKNSLQQKASATAAPDPGSKGIIVGQGQFLTLIGNTIVGFEESYTDAAAVTVKATGNPGQYVFTLSGRDIDRKGMQFNYQADWDGDGTWDQIIPGSTQVTAGGTYTFVRTFTSTNPASVRFRIAPVYDPFNFEWQVGLDFSTTSVKASRSPISAALLVGPTAASMQFSFTLMATNLFGGASTMAFAVDWNNDGDYNDADELRVGVGSASWTRQFSSAGSQTLRYRVSDGLGNRVEATFTFNPGQRNVTFVGSDREDWARFREFSTGNVTVDLTRIGGQSTSRTFTFNNVSSVFADGRGGPDWLHAGGLTTRSATLWGGTDSDSIVGGAGNDTIYGGGPAGTTYMADAPNAISGGAGTNTIVAGNVADVVFSAAGALALLEQDRAFDGAAEQAATPSWDAVRDLVFAANGGSVGIQLGTNFQQGMGSCLGDLGIAWTGPSPVEGQSCCAVPSPTDAARRQLGSDDRSQEGADSTEAEQSNSLGSESVLLPGAGPQAISSSQDASDTVLGAADSPIVEQPNEN